MAFQRSYMVWCPALEETSETGISIPAIDAPHAARKYARLLIAERRVVEGGEPLLIAVSESIEIETAHRVDLGTHRNAA